MYVQFYHSLHGPASIPSPERVANTSHTTTKKHPVPKLHTLRSRPFSVAVFFFLVCFVLHPVLLDEHATQQNMIFFQILLPPIYFLRTSTTGAVSKCEKLVGPAARVHLPGIGPKRMSSTGGGGAGVHAKVSRLASAKIKVCFIAIMHHHRCRQRAPPAWSGSAFARLRTPARTGVNVSRGRPRSASISTR